MASIFQKSTVNVPVLAFSIETPSGLAPRPMSLSPDGKFLALTQQPLSPEAHPLLRVRSLDSDQWRELGDTEGATYPFWSPDGTQIGFFAGGKLKKVALTGGPPQTIAEAPDGRGGSWGNDGTILFSPEPYAQIQRVAESGGEPRPVATPQQGERLARRFPQLLPDGRHFLYLADADPKRSGLFAGSLDGSDPIKLLADTSNAWFVPVETGSERGFLLYARERRLTAQRFDAGRLEFTGGAVALPAVVAAIAHRNYYGFAASDSRLLAYSSATDTEPERLVWADRTGKVVEKTNLAADLQVFNLLPDRRR